MLQHLFSTKDRIFLPLFIEQADLIAEAGNELLAMLQTKEPLLRAEKTKAIVALENRGDEGVRRMLQQLYKTFFAPYDHEDIKDFVLRLDDVLDEINSVSNLIALYEPSNGEIFMETFGKTIQKTTTKIAELIRSLKNPEACRLIFDTIDALEHESDRILGEALYDLFKTEKDPLSIIKYKEIYERLEEVVDHCKDTSDVAEGIVLKYM